MSERKDEQEQQWDHERAAEALVGEKRITRAKQRVIVCHGVHDVLTGGGQVSFYFEDEGPQSFQQRMSIKKWKTYVLAKPDKL